MRVPDIDWPVDLFKDVNTPEPKTMAAAQAPTAMIERPAPWHGWVTNLNGDVHPDSGDREELAGDSVRPHHVA